MSYGKIFIYYFLKRSYVLSKTKNKQGPEQEVKRIKKL